MDKPEKTLVLCVEDEPDQARLITTLLQLRLHADVEIAATCEEARRMLRERDYHVITLDYQLPDGDGLELLSEIVGGASAAPVIMVTGHGDERVAVSALDRGAFSYIVKDRRMSTLLVDAVEKALTHSSYAASEKRLIQQRRLMQSALDTMEDMFLVVDLNGRFIAWNESVKKKLGYTDEEMAARRIADGRSREELRAVLEGMKESLRDDIGTGFEVYLRAKDGKRVLYEFSGAMIRDASGTPVAISGIGRDIAERKRAEEDLKWSERRYRAIIEDQADLIFRITADTFEFTFVNEAFCRYFNIAPEAVLGISCVPLIPRENDPDRVMAHLRRLAAGHELPNTEHKVVLEDGSVKWLVWTGRPIPGEDGRVVEVQVSGHDVTDFKEAERTLFLSEERFRELVESTLDLVSTMRPDGTILFANSSVTRILGYKPRAVIGNNAFAFIHREDLERTVSAVQRALDSPEAEFRVTFRLRHLDGTYRHMETVGTSMRQAGGEERILLNSRDVTRRMEAEEALRMGAARAQTLAEISRRFTEAGLDYVKTLSTIARALAEHIGDNCVVLLLSEDGEYMSVAALEHRDPEAKRLAQGISSARWKLHEGAITTVIRKGVALKTDRFRPDHLSADAADRIEPYRRLYGIHAVIAVPLRVESRVIGVMILSRDTPGRAYSEEDEVLLQDLADRAAMTVEKARLHKRVSDELAKRMERERELEAANRELRLFARNVAHDLKGPIATMKVNLELLKDNYGDTTSEAAGAMLESLLRNVGRSLALVKNLLALAEAGQAPGEPSGVDIERTVNRIVRDNEGELSGRVRIEGELGVVRADQTHIYQLFSNLLLNAVRHNDKDAPEVVVTSVPTAGEDAHRFTVSDNGPGIPPAIRASLFEPFVKGDVAGTGIGLAIVRKILSVYGGSVEVTTGDGGARFDFLINDHPG